MLTFSVEDAETTFLAGAIFLREKGMDGGRMLPLLFREVDTTEKEREREREEYV